MYVDSEKIYYSYALEPNNYFVGAADINGATIQAEKIAKWQSSSDTELSLFYSLHIPKNATYC